MLGYMSNPTYKASDDYPLSVSIHAPAWGATRAGTGCQCFNFGFNPRARVGRDGILYNLLMLQELTAAFCVPSPKDIVTRLKRKAHEKISFKFSGLQLCEAIELWPIASGSQKSENQRPIQVQNWFCPHMLHLALPLLAQVVKAQAVNRRINDLD